MTKAPLLLQAACRRENFRHIFLETGFQNWLRKVQRGWRGCTTM